MRYLICLVGLLAAGVLAGCARFQPKPLSVDQSASEFDRRSLADTGLKAFLEANGMDAPRPRETWDLPALTLAAFYYHPSLEVARAQWHVAQAGIQTAGGRPNPSLSVTPEYNFNAASGVSPWLPATSFDIPIETAGKRGHRIARAEHLSETARLNIAATAWQVRSQVRASLLDFVAAQRRETALRSQAALQDEIAGMLEQRVHAGAIASSELGVVRVALANARADLADARRQQADACARLAEATGVPLSALSEVKLSFDLSHYPATDELVSPDVRRQALQGRSDILGALAEYAASQSALQLEIAKQYPDIHLGTGYQWDQGESKWQLGLTAELPVLNRNQGPIAEAEARRAEAAARFEALQATAVGEIDRAVAVLGASRENLGALESLAAARENWRESVEAQFKAGAADRLDLLTAQFEFSSAALAELDAQTKLQQALGALEDAVQRPLDAAAALPPASFNSSQNSPPPGKEKETQP